MGATPNPAAVGTTITLTANIGDSSTGSSNITSAEFDIDGGSFQPLSASDGSFDEVNEDVTATIGPFVTPAVLQICVRGTDAAGNTGMEECALLAVYDPSNGFAVGGGWIIPGSSTSDVGDLLPGINGISKATFGFVVKYKNGASTIPIGNLEFQYRVGDFNLHSTDYDWLVVTNSNWAKFQGLATINGSGDLYPFRVDARDGDANGGSHEDRFIIKIWASGDDPDVNDPIYKASGDLGGGQIKIHN